MTKDAGFRRPKVQFFEFFAFCFLESLAVLKGLNPVKDTMSFHYLCRQSKIRFRVIRFMKKLAVFCGLLLGTGSKSIGQEFRTDTLLDPVSHIRNFQAELMHRIQKKEEQVAYLESEGSQLPESGDPLHQIEKQKNARVSELKELRFQYHQSLVLLSYARRIPFYSESQRTTLTVRLLKDLQRLESGQVLSAPVSHTLRMDYRDFSDDFPFDCKWQTFEHKEYSTSDYIYVLGFTDPVLEKSVLDHDFIRCYARVIKSKNSDLLELIFEMASVRAKDIYGVLDSKNPLKFIFIDGTYLHMFAIESSLGDYPKGRNLYRYQIQIPLNDLRIKELEQKELDRIQVIWEKGKEEFEVYQLDALQNLMSCLRQQN